MQQHGSILEYYAEWILDQKDYILYSSIHIIFQKKHSGMCKTDLFSNVCTTVEKKSYGNPHSANLTSPNTCRYIKFSDSESFNKLCHLVCRLIIYIPGRDI